MSMLIRKPNPSEKYSVIHYRILNYRINPIFDLFSMLQTSISVREACINANEDEVDNYKN